MKKCKSKGIVVGETKDGGFKKYPKFKYKTIAELDIQLKKFTESNKRDHENN